MTVALGNRMKAYERAFQPTLPRRMPIIIRVDGRAFHTWTKGLDKPFDDQFREVMSKVALDMCREIGGAKMAYTQSDEVSILTTNHDTIDTQPWFDNDLCKIVSQAASVATASFNTHADNLPARKNNGVAFFDARAFVLPDPVEVENYMTWRQRDWENNSLQMLARAHHTQAELQGKSQADLHDMLHTKGVNWNDLPVRHRRGVAVVPKAPRGWMVDVEPPIFTQDRSYIRSCLPVMEAPT